MYIRLSLHVLAEVDRESPGLKFPWGTGLVMLGRDPRLSSPAERDRHEIWIHFTLRKKIQLNSFFFYEKKFSSTLNPALFGSLTWSGFSRADSESYLGDGVFFVHLALVNHPSHATQILFMMGATPIFILTSSFMTQSSCEIPSNQQNILIFLIWSSFSWFVCRANDKVF